MEDEKQTTTMTEKKKTWVRNPRGGPQLNGDALNLEPGDNAKFLNVSMQLMALPKIDLHDAEQVAERLSFFFQIHSEYDMKPTVAGMGLALNGMDRRRLWEIKTGNFGNVRGWNKLPSEAMDLIKRAYRIMENLWENYMQNGKINPMAGVFLGVNNYGYQDVKQVTVTPVTNQQTGNDYDSETIRKRYLIDSGEADEGETS